MESGISDLVKTLIKQVGKHIKMGEWQEAVDASADAVNKARAMNMAVSYTHLTLPTILLV